MSEWKEYKLGEVADVIGGGTPSTTILEYWNGDIAWITPRDLTGYTKVYIKHGDRFITNEGLVNSSTRILPAGTVLLTSRAPIGYVAIAENALCTNQGFKNLIIDSKLADNLYVYYWLKNNTEFLQSIGTGSTFAEISGNTVKGIDILLPPLPEQKAIASVLGSLDDKIDLLHSQNNTLEQMAETLFRQWFIEEAKEDWEVGKLGEDSLGTFQTWIKETVGGDWGKEVIEGDFKKVVYCIRGTDISDLNNGIPNKTPIRFVKESKFKNIEPQEGDLILEISGGTESQSTGRVCYINSDVKSLFNHPLVFSNFCRMIKVKKPEYSYFIYCYLQYLYKQDEFFNLENGSSGIKNLDYKALLFELEYPMPEESKVLLFHETVMPVFKKVNQNKLQIITLTTLRDTLLPKLMSGEVRLGE
jgi:type I restriction enzyme S subunit